MHCTILVTGQLNLKGHLAFINPHFKVSFKTVNKLHYYELLLSWFYHLCKSGSNCSYL